MRYSQDYEIVLTDNASTDGTGRFFDACRDRFPNMIRVVHNADNLGFQEPNRRALEMARGEFFVMLNNDTQVKSGWLPALLKPFADPSVAITGPDGGCCEILPDFNGCGGSRLEYIEGSCLMIRSELARRHGLFAPYLEFAYGEDADLSLRMREQGYKLATVPMKLHHVRGATSRSVPNIGEYQEKNHRALRDRWKHYLGVRIMDYPVIVKRRASLGDVLLTTPVIRALKLARPVSPIVVVTDAPELFDRNPYVYAATKSHTDPNALVIDLDMAYENRPGISIIDAYADVAGVDVEDRSLVFNTTPDALEWAGAAYGRKATKRVVAIHPGPGTWTGKNWPADRFAELSHALTREGFEILLVGGDGTHEIPNHFDIRRATIDQAAAALFGCCLFVGIDSFPIHLAMSQGVPVVGLFGTSSPEFILSAGKAIGLHADPAVVPCAGARHRVAGQTFVDCDGACMRAISVEMVLDAVRELKAAEAEAS